MEEFTEETQRFREECSTGRHVEEMEKLTNKFQSLDEELREFKKDFCLQNGYTEIRITQTDNEYLAPEKMSKRQLVDIVRQVPSSLPEESRLYYLVDDDLLSNVRNQDGYEELVEKRRDVLSEMKDVLSDFLSENSLRQETETMQIVAIYAVFNQETLDSSIISDVIGCSETMVSEFGVIDDVVKRDTSPRTSRNMS